MMGKVSEMFSEVKDQLHERVSSPLAGTFLISWCVWNYQFLLVLLGDMTTSEKIIYIGNNLYSSGWVTTNSLFIGPLLTAMVYIWLYPIVGKSFFVYSREQQNILKDLKQQIDGESLLTEKESKELRTEVIKAQNSANNAIRDQEHMLSENERLQKEVDALQKQISEFEASKSNVSDAEAGSIASTVSDNEGMTQILEYIGQNASDYVPRSEVIDTFGKHFTKIFLDSYLDKLLHSNLISKSSMGNYSITKEGRTLLMDLVKQQSEQDK